MQKVSHSKGYTLLYEGQQWVIEFAIWINPASTKGELRVYRIEGDVTSPLLSQALEDLAQQKSLSTLLQSER